MARPGALEKLSERFRLAVFTGRPREEADITLNRFASGLAFDPVVGMHDVEKRKPHPEGLLKILGGDGAGPAYYIGDSVDDARCARAAGVPFIGIAAPSNPAYLDLVFLFQEEKAYAIVDDINYLEDVFA
jgi:phosphoglycolate phosphatase-like HAD superfamily hydrolase